MFVPFAAANGESADESRRQRYNLFMIFNASSVGKLKIFQVYKSGQRTKKKKQRPSGEGTTATISQATGIC